ncbi:AP endonuclease [Desulfoluna limicola]|uniref:AP endonuclease n=1 Tax=Desulfoluna limicola TaxID=2810562 RepID=A0ABM7PLE2_9BACT|nr:sugar phosphate isomerase/epimerase family protein [Desulfoluna limicola]BCS98349.1 AP endonuclease [Desulfoluna limicola]
MVYNETMRAAARCVQVNVPYRMLVEEGLFDLFLSLGLNPELGMDIPTLETYGQPHFEKTAKTFREAGARLTLHGPFEGVDPGSADASLRKRSEGHLQLLVKAVEAIRPTSVVCHTGFHPDTHAAGFPGWLERSRTAWAKLAATFNALGVHFLLENVHERTPAEMASMVSGIDNLGLCLDTGHLHAYGDGNLNGWMDTLGALTREVHLHDNHGMVDEHLPPGQGTIDFTPVFDLAQRQPLIVTLEPHTEADLRPALDFLVLHPGLLRE